METRSNRSKGVTLEVIAFIVPCINLITAIINLYVMLHLLP